LSRPEHLRADVTRTLERVTHTPHPSRSARGARSVVARPSSRRDGTQWLSHEAQSRAIALAAEFSMSVDAVVTLAVNLLAVQCRNPKKREALAQLLTKESQSVVRPHRSPGS